MSSVDIFKKIIKMSRPRFWLYLAGPFLIGFAAGADNLAAYQNPWFFLLLLYFLIPANFYLYGINDYFDLDTDRLNAKKSGKEILLAEPLIRKITQRIIFATLLLSSVLLFFLPGAVNKVIFLLFVLLATGYSLPPVRFKRYPGIDSLSNILYALPGFIGYILTSGQLPPLTALIAAWAWTAAMHLFSAIPDIAPDKTADLKTSAVWLGRKKSLIACFLLWILFAAIVVLNRFALPLAYLFFAYPLLPLLAWPSTNRLEKIYWQFPFLTGLFGFLTFWHLFLSRIL